MKSNVLRIFLEWALITSVLMSVGFFTWYLLKSRTARALEIQVAADQDHYNRINVFFNKLGAECNEYAKTSPDMQKLLASMSQTPPAAPGKPAVR